MAHSDEDVVILDKQRSDESDTDLEDSAARSSESESDTDWRTAGKKLVEQPNEDSKTTTEQARRNLAISFRDAVRRDDDQAHLSRSEAILLLRLSNFDFDTAYEAFDDLGSARALLSQTYDHTRTRNPSQSDQDERLAILTGITDRVDIHSVLQFLIARRWNLIISITDWFTNGIPVVRHKKDRQGEGRRRDYMGEPRNAPTAKKIVPVTEEAADLWADERKEYKRGGSKKYLRPGTKTTKATTRLPGFLLVEDREPAVTGRPDPWKYLIEYVQKGKGKDNVFSHKAYRWPKGDGTDSDKAAKTKPEFDWSKTRDIERLNQWRRQAFRRITLNDARPASQHWSQAEIDFLYDLHDKFLKQLMVKNPTKSRDQLLPFKVSAAVSKDWTDRYNKRFVGTTPVGHTKPIHARNKGAIMQQRHRNEGLIKAFKIKPDTTSSKRKAAHCPDNQDVHKKARTNAAATSVPTAPQAIWQHDIASFEAQIGKLPHREEDNALHHGLDADGYLRSAAFSDNVLIESIQVQAADMDDFGLQWALTLTLAVDFYRTRQTSQDVEAFRGFLRGINLSDVLDPLRNTQMEIWRELWHKWQQTRKREREIRDRRGY